ncbi:sodium-potassium ATPase [Russula earlei]|uniref:Sodium-potassium ATPase n=1 Tax=Russula earlei TaxID=71964 RepID=A0ACC0U8J2_9AGAM|nr:sodium-potassium ATPase [Russula earlei]
MSATSRSTARRTLSIHAPTVPPSARLPIEFRTLSLHLEHSKNLKLGESGRGKESKGNVKDLSDLDWHNLSIDEALRRLAVAPKTGLDAAQAQRRAAQFGANQISPPPRRMLRKVAGWVFGGFGSLLLVASIICFLSWKPLGNPNPQASNLALAVVLLVVVFFQAIFNAWQDFSTSRVMASIQGMLPTDVVALRDGMQTTLPAASLVPGDLVHVVMGQKVPADVKLIDVSGDLRFDRSVLTGESEPITGRVDKTNDNILETKNIALQGTLCVSGSGLGLVFQIGDNTVFGRIAKLSSAGHSSLTTLQREILRFVLIIAGLATLVAILIVILWATWLRRSYPGFINTPTLLIDVVSVMVAFIPEGLPVAVTLSLAKVAHTLSKHKVLCKSLSIVETLGSVNVLCSDKTGTLTQNRMHVEDAAIYDVAFDVQTLHQRLESAEHQLAENLRQLPAVSAICNAAAFEGSPSDSKRNIIGDATDSAILKFSDNVVSSDTVRAQWRHVHKIPFNSKTKFMLTISEVMPRTNDSGLLPAPLASWDSFAPADLLLCVKGAPDVLLMRCTHVVAPGGDRPLNLTYAARQRIVAIQDQWAAQGRRVLLLARRVVARELLPQKIDSYAEGFDELIDGLNSELIIVGLVGLIDPLKPDIPDTVRICRGAGIRFFVVTGDHPATAVAIAAQAGIISNSAVVHHASDLLNHGSIQEKEQKEKDDALLEQEPSHSAAPQSIVITGAELETLTPEQEDVLCTYQEIVFARTTPEQKLRIVRSFQSRGGVVGVTGDGVNDAPALRAADCGIAMGSGSDVAREAADMVLLEDFSAIVVALEYGRLVYDNLKKTILYLLPAGSMCLEPPESGLLSRPPRNVRKERLANGRLLLHAYGFLGILESLCAMAMSFWYLQRNGVPFSSLAMKFGNYPAALTNDLLYEAQTVYFFTLVVMQWGNLLSTRTRRSSIFQQPPTWGLNPSTIPAAICALLIGIFFSYVPAFHNVFQTSNIPARHFLIPIPFALALIILDETRKLIVRTYPRSFVAWIAW